MSALRRCAVYTRKSTEEGLEQDFNSLDAQREACEAYIRSQVGEGWKLVRAHYDDGGYSGGTMDRPALQHLLDDIRAHRIDTVVVYKVDRLTRSLADFAKIVEVFDGHGISFVSVTQQFNTTTSMGRLTLNMLLSFAQFEREVTGERIRDKIAASKKKGMWMGGPPPLGYDVRDRKLVINEAEAEEVRRLFGLYLNLGTVRRLKAEADRLSITTKRRRQKDGTMVGGKPLSRGNLYLMLSNPLYVGRVAHKGETYPGQHRAIIDEKSWDAVQAQLAGNAMSRRSPTNTKADFLLTSLVFDDQGERLCQAQAHKGVRRYRYYISRRLVHDADRHDGGWRLPARRLESAVMAPLVKLLRDPVRIMDLLGLIDLAPVPLARMIARAETLVEQLTLADAKAKRELLHHVLNRVDLAPDRMVLAIRRQGLAEALDITTVSGNDGIAEINVPIAIQRRGVESKLIIADSAAENRDPDPSLCRLTSRARVWFDQLADGEIASVRAIAQRDDVNESEITRVLPLAFLAPDIVQAILGGRHPEALTGERLKRFSPLPTDWEAQRRTLGFNS